MPLQAPPDALHLTILSNAIAPWLGGASAAKRGALAANPPAVADWYSTITDLQHEKLKRLNGEAWTTQNRVDQAFSAIKSPEDFGAELLQKALKDEFDLDANVRTTYLQLYIPLTLAGITVKPGAARTWSVSLLDAALHNFEAAEATDGAYERNSGFTTAPSATGHFVSLPGFDEKISVVQFTTLCRRLDIGGQYQRYLDQALDLDNPVARTALQYWLKQSHLAALKLALFMAVLNKDLPTDHYLRLLNLINQDHPGHSDCPHVLGHDLFIMGCRLTGIVLFAQDLQASRGVEPVVAYIPDDPEHPIKYYASSAQFSQALATKLRSTDYQRFFSRFVRHADAGVFFANLNQRLSQVEWHPHTVGDPRPSWRDTPVSRPKLQLSSEKIDSGLFEHLFEMKLSKLLDDARSRAVSTATANQKARWARWALLQTIGEALLQAIAFVAMPFIPPLGALMLAYTAYQVLDEAFEGVIEWAEGLQREALGHALGLMEQLVQLGLFATGLPIAEALLRQKLPKELLQFIDRFKPVTLPNGNRRLWRPDLTPYRQALRLPTDARADAKGLHQHAGKTLLRLDGEHYQVQQDPRSGRYYLQHPTRPGAYQPPVMTNGQGAWLTELENPLGWDRSTLLRRLGDQTETLSDTQLARARDASATHDNTLRHMHATQQTPPPLLADTLKRFKIDQQLQDFITQMNSDDPAIYTKADAQTQLQLLTSYDWWPTSKTLRVVDTRGETLWQYKGKEGASVVQVLDAQLRNGDLLPTLIEGLNETERKQLLEEEFGVPPSSPHTRAATLRKKLARLAQDKRYSLFDSHYRGQNRAGNARLQKIIDSTSRPGLPTCIAEELLANATGDELKAIDAGKVPLRLVELAEWSLHEVRTTRAYEGLYMETMETPDTARLALHSLENLPGWPTWIRLEMRQYHAAGKLLDAIGPRYALTQRTLVEIPDGQYIPHDDQGPLFGTTDLYTAILQALPDTARDALGIHIGQGPRLKQAIGEHPLDRNILRQLLGSDPLLKPTYNPSVMRLRGGMEGYRPGPPEQPGPSQLPSLEQQIQTLRPALTQEPIRELLTTLGRGPEGAQLGLDRLRNEYMRLDIDLLAWESSTPSVHPESGVPLSDTDREYLRRDRQLFSHQLRRAWRQETPIDAFYETPTLNGHVLRLTVPRIGELPHLNARFDHIAYLELQGVNQTVEVNPFLSHFPRLRNLSIRDLRLGELPASISSQSHLNELILNNCNITLTPSSQATINGMNRLLTLDLYNNPLTLLPSVEQMPNLNYLDLGNTGISQLPPGLLNLNQPSLVILSNNHISELPLPLFDLPTATTDHYVLSGNPLSYQTLEHVKAYFRRTGKYLEATPDSADVAQAKRLFPRSDNDAINRFIFGLPGDLAAGRAEMTQMEADLLKIREDLTPWAEHSEIDTQERERRHYFITALEAGWRREITSGEHFEDGAASYAFILHRPISGELPRLRTRFNHIAALTLKGTGETLRLGEFLQSFPNINTLTLEHYSLGELPDLSPLHQLAELTLNQCDIHLSPSSAITLQSMRDLKLLDLSNNPLGWVPDFGQMPQLTNLSLHNTGLTAFPASLITPPTVRARVDLSHNSISELPDEAFMLPASISASFDLADNPLSLATLNRVKHYCQATREHWNVSLADGNLQRIKALFPMLSEEDAKRELFLLPGELQNASEHITRLGLEYAQLETDLHAWVLDVPLRDPLLDTVLDENSRAEEQIRRLHFKDLLLRCWRREVELDDSETLQRHTYKLVFHGQLLGDLPVLSARFEHVTLLELLGEGTNQQIDGLLRGFPNLKSLSVERHALTAIPDSVFSLNQLHLLNLSENLIRLTPDSTDQLSRLGDLIHLDLSDNPLNNRLDVRNLSHLTTLYLHNCGLTEVPLGTFNLPQLRTLDLSDNLIEHLPTDLLDMPLPLNDDTDLSGNPLSAESLAILRTYYRQTGYELGVEEAMYDEHGVALTPPGTPDPMEE